ncbi:MAG: RidA family protein [Coriobacteriia bacterium]|nr:RidA family protein [Coriobacteriia bacterium]
MSVAARLEAAGLRLPAPPAPKGSYVPAVLAGGLVFTAGQLPVLDGALLTSGRVGAEVSEGTARTCARQAALNALAAAAVVCSLDEVTAVVKLVGYVASAERFQARPAVVDGASEVLLTAFGERGRHAREAVGVAALPLGAPVEVSLILAL